MDFNPNHFSDRIILAAALHSKMGECGFTVRPEDGFTKELVFERPVEGSNDSISILVYTSIVKVGHQLATRDVGEDAIRVCAIYKAKDGKERGLARAEKRVFRVGTVEGVVDRTHKRMREVWTCARTSVRCNFCGAPKFLSRAKKEVCADLCWTKR